MVWRGCGVSKGDEIEQFFRLVSIPLSLGGQGVGGRELGSKR